MERWMKMLLLIAVAAATSIAVVTTVLLIPALTANDEKFSNKSTDGSSAWDEGNGEEIVNTRAQGSELKGNNSLDGSSAWDEEGSGEEIVNTRAQGSELKGNNSLDGSSAWDEEGSGEGLSVSPDYPFQEDENLNISSSKYGSGLGEEWNVTFEHK